MNETTCGRGRWRKRYRVEFTRANDLRIEVETVDITADDFAQARRIFDCYHWLQPNSLVDVKYLHEQLVCAKCNLELANDLQAVPNCSRCALEGS